MTAKQKIELRLSQVRERLNEISGLEGDAFTDENPHRGGNPPDRVRRPGSPPPRGHRRRAPETKTEGAEDGEAVELRAIRGRVHLADYAAAAKSGRA